MNHSMKKHVATIALALIFEGNACAQTFGDSITQIRIDPLLELEFNQVGERLCAEYQEIFKQCIIGRKFSFLPVTNNRFVRS